MRQTGAIVPSGLRTPTSWAPWRILSRLKHRGRPCSLPSDATLGSWGGRGFSWEAGRSRLGKRRATAHIYGFTCRRVNFPNRGSRTSRAMASSFPCLQPSRPDRFPHLNAAGSRQVIECRYDGLHAFSSDLFHP